MPLRALVDGREIQVWDLTGEQWTGLKQRCRTAAVAIRMACCGEPGTAKTSRTGNPFFAHHPQSRPAVTCRWADESVTHATCKLLAAAGARAAGWEVQTEAAAPDRSWRADVLCRRGRVRVALEIQLARTTLAAICARQERYRRAGIRAAWFLPAPLCSEPSYELPAFSLAAEELAHGTAWVSLDNDAGGTLPLDGFVAHLLQGRIRFETERILRQLDCSIAVAALDACRRCGKPFEHVVGLTNIATAQPHYYIDGVPITALRDLWWADRQQAWSVIGCVEGLCRTAPQLSRLAPRFCPIVREAYLMACCPNCRAKQGDSSVDRLLTSVHPHVPVRVPVPPVPLTFRPLDGRPPRSTLSDWRERVVPARWHLELGELGLQQLPCPPVA